MAFQLAHPITVGAAGLHTRTGDAVGLAGPGAILATPMVLTTMNASQKNALLASLVGMGGLVACVRMGAWKLTTPNASPASMWQIWKVLLRQSWQTQVQVKARPMQGVFQVSMFMEDLDPSAHVQATGGHLDLCVAQISVMGTLASGQQVMVTSDATGTQQMIGESGNCVSGQR